MSPEGDLDSDREQLLGRLQNLRSILPVFAQEVASARRATARLRMENGRLQKQVRQLQRRRAAEDGTLQPGSRFSRSGRRADLAERPRPSGHDEDRTARFVHHSP